jgi:hypothetical protein
MGEFPAQIATQEWWGGFGFWVLVVGLAGELAVLAIPEHRGRLEKGLAAIFTVVVIIGCAFEHVADNRIAILVSREEAAAGRKIVQTQTQIETTIGERDVTPARADIIRRTVLPGANIVIIAMDESEKGFANALRNAFISGQANVPPVLVNSIINGMTGLLVDFDQTDPMAKSVFAALDHAGFNPIRQSGTAGQTIIRIWPRP